MDGVNQNLHLHLRSPLRYLMLDIHTFLLEPLPVCVYSYVGYQGLGGDLQLDRVASVWSK